MCSTNQQIQQAINGFFKNLFEEVRMKNDAFLFIVDEIASINANTSFKSIHHLYAEYIQPEFRQKQPPFLENILFCIFVQNINFFLMMTNAAYQNEGKVAYLIKTNGSNVDNEIEIQ